MVRNDLARTVLSIVFIGLLLSASLWVLRPFLPALIWATMIVVATWPLMLRAQSLLFGRRWLAVALMSGVLLLMFVLPFLWAIGALTAHASDIADWTSVLDGLNLPAPDWLAQLPLVGEKLAQLWNDINQLGLEGLGKKLAPHSREIAQWLLGKIGNLTMVGIQFLLIVLLSAVLYAHGEVAAQGARRFGSRLAGHYGEESIDLAGRAIRGVMLGIVVTALIQSLLGGIGLAVAGVPYAPVLTALMFILAVAQIGAGPVLIGALYWIYNHDSGGVFAAFLIWSIFVGTIDNFIRPFLIRKGADLPLLLVFAGVIGGLLAFGLIGLFIGPVTLAVSYTLLKAWVEREPLVTAATGGTE